MNKNSAAARRPFIKAALLVSWLCLVSGNARAAEPAAAGAAPPAGPVPTEVFEGARILRGPSSLAYPARELDHRTEGWALINTMISPGGRPYEITVIDSSGNATLDEAAIKAVNEMTFRPATSRSTPVDSSLAFTLRFSTGGAARFASDAFVASFQNFVKVFGTGDKTRVEAALARLQVQNLYEDAFRSYAQYLHDQKWGTDLEQLRDLRHALSGDGTGHFLTRQMFDAALVAKFELEAKDNDYGDALMTWKALQPRVPAASRAELQRLAQQITAARDSGQPVTTSGAIDRHSWGSRLFKKRFTIAVTGGSVSEIKLRCTQHYLFFKYTPDVQYAVDPNVGECWIEIIGDPGTTFKLTQS